MMCQKQARKIILRTKNSVQIETTPHKMITLPIDHWYSYPSKIANLLLDGDLNHLHRGDGIVISGARGVDGFDDILAINHTTKHRVLRRGALVKEVQEAVVDNINEELTASRVRLAGVSHGESEWLIRQSWA